MFSTAIQIPLPNTILILLCVSYHRHLRYEATTTTGHTSRKPQGLSSSSAHQPAMASCPTPLLSCERSLFKPSARTQSKTQLSPSPALSAVPIPILLPLNISSL